MASGPQQIGMFDPLPAVAVRELEPVVAAPGTRVSFECSFNIDNYPYYFVVWYLGRYEIKRTNTLFDVISFGSQRLLYIKRVREDMGGEVICELRRALPKCQSLLVTRSIASLVVVPKHFLDNEICPTLSVGPRVYRTDVEAPYYSAAAPRRNLEASTKQEYINQQVNLEASTKQEYINQQVNLEASTKQEYINQQVNPEASTKQEYINQQVNLEASTKQEYINQQVNLEASTKQEYINQQVNLEASTKQDYINQQVNLEASTKQEYINQQVNLEASTKQEYINQQVNLEASTKQEYINQQVNPEASTKQEYINQQVLEILFCRLEEVVYYADMKSSFANLSPTIRVKHTIECIELYEVYFEWNIAEDLWYKVTMENEDCTMSLLAYAIEPRFCLNQPAVGRLARIVVTGIAPLSVQGCDALADINLKIAMPEPAELEYKSPNSYELQSISEFQENYFSTGDILGIGGFGKVTLVRNLNGQFFAAKIINTNTNKKRTFALREYNAMCQLQNKNIVRLEDGYVDRALNYYVLVMEFLWGGELLNRIVCEEIFKEEDVIPYVRQILEALQYLHSKRIAHFDVKPENIMCVRPDSTQIKLVDFGLARIIVGSKRVQTIYGTKVYVAPEMINFEKMSVACDMWSAGVVTYTLLSGTTPFPSDDFGVQTNNIIRAIYNYDDPAFEAVSALAKNFVDQLLTKNVKERMTAAEALQHPWITRRASPNLNESNDMTVARRNLRHYLQTYRERWQRAGNFVTAAGRFRTGLRDRFHGLFLCHSATIIEEPDNE